jgi:hypothetical protein
VSHISAKVIFWGRLVMPHGSADRRGGEAARGWWNRSYVIPNQENSRLIQLPNCSQTDGAFLKALSQSAYCDLSGISPSLRARVQSAGYCLGTSNRYFHQLRARSFLSSSNKTIRRRAPCRKRCNHQPDEKAHRRYLQSADLPFRRDKLRR